jgi:spore germination protein YaaH
MRNQTLTACLLLLLLASCRREYNMLKTSIRSTATEYSMLERDLNRLVSKVDKAGQKKTLDSLRKAMASDRQQNLINNYDYLYTSLNLREPTKAAMDLKWDSTLRTFYYRNPDTLRVVSGREVFGWHPTWMGDNWMSYPYNLLTTVAFFSYNIDPATGSFQNPEDIAVWRSIALVDSAHANNCRVLLSVACAGTEQVDQFLTNQVAWTTLGDSVTQLLSEKKADGVEISFSDIPFERKRAFNEFVRTFSGKVKASLGEGKGYVAITLPPVNDPGVFDVTELQRHVDLCVVQGFEYPNDEQSSGAAAPLIAKTQKGPSLDNTLRSYLGEGLDMGKSILALPLYAMQWKGKLGGRGFYDTRFDRKLTYSEVKTLYRGDDTSYSLTPTLDRLSMTNYYLLEFPDKTSVECWFDDDYTLGRKFDLALSRGLRGVGLWALGYDQGRTEIWDLVKGKMAVDTVAVADPVNVIKGYPIRMADFFHRYADMLMTAAVLFALTVAASLFIAFTDWRVRESFFYGHFNFYLYIFACTLLLVPLLSLLDFFGGSRLSLLPAFGVGVATGYLIFRLTRVLQFRRP